MQSSHDDVQLLDVIPKILDLSGDTRQDSETVGPGAPREGLPGGLPKGGGGRREGAVAAVAAGAAAAAAAGPAAARDCATPAAAACPRARGRGAARGRRGRGGRAIDADPGPGVPARWGGAVRANSRSCRHLTGSAQQPPHGPSSSQQSSPLAQVLELSLQDQ